MNVIIYHDADCGTSANTLMFIRRALKRPTTRLRWGDPVLTDRPVAVSTIGVRLCRPCELVIDLLPPKRGEFRKGDGELVINQSGRLVR
jgi:hypothetical protein